MGFWTMILLQIMLPHGLAMESVQQENTWTSLLIDIDPIQGMLHPVIYFDKNPNMWEKIHLS